MATKKTRPKASVDANRYPVLAQGDAIDGIGDLAARGFRFTLAYLDPPFLSGRVYTMPDGEVAFDDRWPSMDVYLAKLLNVCESARSVLTDDGCLVLHVDTKVSHYAKVMLDELFGRKAFASEIVWRYRRWPSKTPNFQRVHDVLLRYRKNPDAAPRFRQLYEPLSPKTEKQWGQRKQRAVLTDGSKGPARRIRSSTTSEASPGAPLGDVWDIGIIGPSANERTGFPTQKPEALLERLIASTTEPGDWVLDPFCGSGTTLAVATRLGRHSAGIDSSDVAIRVASERLGLPSHEEADRACTGSCSKQFEARVVSW